MGQLSYLYFDGQYADDDEEQRFFARAVVATLKDLFADARFQDFEAGSAQEQRHNVVLDLTASCPPGEDPFWWEMKREQAATGLLGKLLTRHGVGISSEPASSTSDGGDDWEEEEWGFADEDSDGAASEAEVDYPDDASSAYWLGGSSSSEEEDLGSWPGSSVTSSASEEEEDLGSWPGSSVSSSASGEEDLGSWPGSSVSNWCSRRGAIPLISSSSESSWDSEEHAELAEAELAKRYTLDGGTMRLLFPEWLNTRQLRALLRTLRRWYHRAFPEADAAERDGRQWDKLIDHLSRTCHDQESMLQLAKLVVAAQGEHLTEMLDEARSSGVAAFQGVFPYLHAFEYSPLNPSGPRQSHLGQGDLLWTNGFGVFAAVEAKDLGGKSKYSRQVARNKVYEQARRYASQVLLHRPEAVLVLPFTAVAAGGLSLSTVLFMRAGQLCGLTEYALLQKHADCFATDS